MVKLYAVSLIPWPWADTALPSLCLPYLLTSCEPAADAGPCGETLDQAALSCQCEVGYDSGLISAVRDGLI